MEPMHSSELLPDSQVETRPDAPAPIVSHASTHESRVMRLLLRLAVRPGALNGPLTRELNKCVSEFRSWTRCPPTPEVRARVLARFDSLDEQALSYLMGDK